jgi:hypothetical protein
MHVFIQTRRSGAPIKSPPLSIALITLLRPHTEPHRFLHLRCLILQLSEALLQFQRLNLIGQHLTVFTQLPQRFLRLHSFLAIDALAHIVASSRCVNASDCCGFSELCSLTNHKTFQWFRAKGPVERSRVYRALLLFLTKLFKAAWARLGLPKQTIFLL